MVEPLNDLMRREEPAEPKVSPAPPAPRMAAASHVAEKPS